VRRRHATVTVTSSDRALAFDDDRQQSVTEQRGRVV
jgi:hypothetical protein